MVYAGVNALAVLVAAFAGYLFSAAWAMALAKPWLRAAELSPEQRARLDAAVRRAPAPFLISLLAQLLMAYLFASLMGHLGPAAATLRGGLLSGFLLWLGFVATTIAANYAFGMRRLALALIDGGGWLGVLLIQGAVIGLAGR